MWVKGFLHFELAFIRKANVNSLQIPRDKHRAAAVQLVQLVFKFIDVNTSLVLCLYFDIFFYFIELLGLLVEKLLSFDCKAALLFDFDQSLTFNLHLNNLGWLLDWPFLGFR